MKLIESEKLEKLTQFDIKQIDVYNKKEVKRIIDITTEMAKICGENGGVGLSACQVGINEQFLIFRIDEKSFGVIVNPSWVPTASRYKTVEGCLSYPKESYVVKRYKKIQASYWTIDKDDFKFVRRDFTNETAQIFQHEADHCRAVTIAQKGKKYK